MFWRKVLLGRFNAYRNHVSLDYLLCKNVLQHSNYSCFTRMKCNNQKLACHPLICEDSNLLSLISQPQRKYSQNTIDDVVRGIQNSQQENEYKTIADLFPQPRVTLKEFQEKMSQKVYEVYYKQNVMSPKGVRKTKKAVQNDWTCSYVLSWPEKIKFDGSALSKRLAAEKAAIQTLHFLYMKNKIDQRGNPVYDKAVIDKLKSSFDEPIRAEISEMSMERIGRIWEEYLDGIKNIYEATFEEAKHKIMPSPSVLTRDSTIDEEDGTPEIDNSLEKEVDDLADLKIPVHPVYGRPFTEPSKSTLERRDRVLNQKFETYDENLLPLPIDQYASEITSTIASNRVTIIVGAAGCGKSTRVPAAILRNLRAKTAAIVTEPRRVAAIGLAERVAEEMGEQVGDSIGYQVRLHAKPPRPPGGSILYCTSGVLLRRLQTNAGLSGCSHVFIDEAHERDVNTDLTLLLLKRAINLNPELKVVVMSATLDVGVFTKYFDACPVIEVPGRTFPVEISYLDDIQNTFNLRLRYTLENSLKEGGKPMVNCQEVVEVIKAVDKTQPEGAILVFLPGWAEIKQTKLLLDECFGEDNLHLILPVHSRLSTTDQTKMFSRPLPGVRKIVLATNIAETSITIPDVVHVIDTGAHKENRIREGTGTASLETVWVSQAGAKQRTGRAGRVRHGHCYRMYTKGKEMEFEPHTTPEILRIPLEQTVLECKTYAPNETILEFFSQLPEPPSKKAIEFAVNDLVDLGALTPSEQVTTLGYLLSKLTLHPRLGRSLLNGALIGNLVAMANVVTYCSDNVELFVNASDRRDEIRAIKNKFHPTSDLASLHHIQEEFERIMKEDRSEIGEWCYKYGMRRDRLHYVKSISNLYLEQLLKLNLLESTIDPADLNRFSDEDTLTSAVLLSGSDSILRTRKTVKTKGKLATTVKLVTSAGDRAHVGAESVNYATSKRSPNSLMAYFGGFHSLERRALVVYKTSLIPPETALLFSKGNIRLQELDDETAVLSLPKHKLEVHVHKRYYDLLACILEGVFYPLTNNGVVQWFRKFENPPQQRSASPLHRRRARQTASKMAIFDFFLSSLPSIYGSQAVFIMKAKEMLWNTLQYYIERDLKTLDYDVNTRIFRFKTRLVKAVSKLLAESHRDIEGKCVIRNEKKD